MAQPGNTPPKAASGRVRGRFWWLKIVLGFALVALLIVEGTILWPRLNEYWQALTEIHWGWVAACLAAQAVSLSGYASVQQRLLNAAGVVAGHVKNLSVIYASTAMALTLPAGQVFSTAFTYKQTRKWGATPVVASWQLAMCGVIAAATLAILGATGAVAFGTKVSPVTLTISIVGMAALFLGLRYIAQNPGSIERIGHRVLARYNNFRDNSADRGVARWSEILKQLDAVELSRTDTAIAFGWSTVHRVADVLCLGFACWAVGADPSFAGLLIAFTAAKAVGSIPLMPGGLGVVEPVLVTALIMAGSSWAQAAAAVFVYRIVSLVLVVLAGWLVFLVSFRATHHDDLDIDVEFERREQPGV
ncbi:YbhN family protein [Rhodococcus sp. ARC_M6]|uniref:lysylphosphatidylglycerol synthase transmembrane domain-containing protein n=1 Tax=Rhodococcus sp. ARC_M6 TaxID=2928852 RepID=UPI001FB1C360|nr:YbhN family protein [Rhodococcus sp. ARC_M6]MCJ0902008.1 YbhN family protein [Rhodococcus sp. ARC_M6]